MRRKIVKEVEHNIESSINHLNNMAISEEGEKYSASLKKLSENLRFTDNSIAVPEDM